MCIWFPITSRRRNAFSCMLLTSSLVHTYDCVIVVEPFPLIFRFLIGQRVLTPRGYITSSCSGGRLTSAAYALPKMCFWKYPRTFRQGLRQMEKYRVAFIKTLTFVCISVIIYLTFKLEFTLRVYLRLHLDFAHPALIAGPPIDWYAGSYG